MRAASIVLEHSWIREKEKIKEERDRDKDNVCGGEKQEEEEEEEEKKKKKKTYGWNEMRERRNNIKNKKS